MGGHARKDGPRLVAPSAPPDVAVDSPDLRPDSAILIAAPKKTVALIPYRVRVEGADFLFVLTSCHFSKFMLISSGNS